MAKRGASSTSVASRHGSWWRQAEVFNIASAVIQPGYDGMFWWQTIAKTKVGFTTHCPIDKGFIARSHALGVRCFPYVTFYVASDHVSFGPVASSTYQGVDFGKHPDFFEIDELGKPRTWDFGMSPDGVNIKFDDAPEVRITCPNVEAYQDKMVDWVEYVMDLGADGLFVDNVLPRTWGLCHGKHKHIFHEDPADPNAAQSKAYALLLKRVHKAVIERKRDGLLLGNSSDPTKLPKEWRQYLDSDMREGYVCHVEKGLTVRGDWEKDHAWGTTFQSYMASGKQILAISDLGSTYGVREDAFLCYATARLAGFIWGTGAQAREEVFDLFQFHLGPPVSREHRTTGEEPVYYRVFENGLVAVNPHASKPGKLPVKAPIPGTLFHDLFLGWQPASSIPIDVGTTGGALTIPPHSGRIYLFATSTDYGLNRLT